MQPVNPVSVAHALPRRTLEAAAALWARLAVFRCGAMARQREKQSPEIFQREVMR